MVSEVKINNIYDRQVNIISKPPYNQVVSIVEKGKDLSKFGDRPVLSTTKATVWSVDGVNHETYATTNSIDTLSSDDAGNTQLVTVEGHYLDDNDDLVFHTQTATLSGLSKVTLTQPLARLTRLFNSGSVDFATSSNVYGYEDTAIVSGVPTDKTKIHIQVLAEYNQSTKAATSISAKDYYIIEQWSCGVRKNAGSPEVDFFLEVREQGGVFKTKRIMSLSNGENFVLSINEIIKPNSDIRVTAISSASAEVQSNFSGYLAVIENQA